jgi:beta-glucanase (GH16 family)
VTTQTNNLEWYDPAAITTSDGALEITLSKKETHGLQYQGGMMTTWNKFCFTGGRIETSVSLPGASNVMGLWPAIWAMGNLGMLRLSLLFTCPSYSSNSMIGRAGYGASLEGMVNLFKTYSPL